MRRNSWNPFSYPPRAVIKSVWGFFLPGLAILLKALLDNGTVSWADAGVAFLTSCVTGYSVFAADNVDSRPAESEYGYASIMLIVGVVLVILGLLGLFKVLAFTFVIAVVLVVIGLILVVFAGRGGTRL